MRCYMKPWLDRRETGPWGRYLAWRFCDPNRDVDFKGRAPEEEPIVLEGPTSRGYFYVQWGNA
jgi:hypothetical protein